PACAPLIRFLKPSSYQPSQQYDHGHDYGLNCLSGFGNFIFCSSVRLKLKGYIKLHRLAAVFAPISAHVPLLAAEKSLENIPTIAKRRCPQSPARGIKSGCI
ncbi:MAG TPA: hypothetical protein VJ904_11690, partial [Tichowtungia sp.]|nr:hypothetical protein [Tichowtungia sp.]